jgi:hypothetical protein
LIVGMLVNKVQYDMWLDEIVSRRVAEAQRNSGPLNQRVFPSSAGRAFARDPKEASFEMRLG